MVKTKEKVIIIIKLRKRLIFGSLVLLFTFTLLTIPISSAVDFPSDSFCVDDKRDWDFLWDITQFDNLSYTDPIFSSVGDMFKWDINQIATSCPFDLCIDEIYGKVSYMSADIGIWTDLTGNLAYLGGYRRYGDIPFSSSIYGPMIAPRNASAIFQDLNETYSFENNNISSKTASGFLVIVTIFNGTPYANGKMYEELAFNNDGILSYWLKAIGNGTSWVPVFRLEYQAKPGIPGFPLLLTILALTTLLSIYTLIPKKKRY